MENNEKQTFNYTYSADEQKEIKKIRDKYIPTEDTEDKMEQLRRLDASVTSSATAIALVFGIVGVLILGLGMSIVMTEFRDILGAYSDYCLPIGIAVGVFGMILSSVAYPIYNRTVKKKREKIAPEIIRLSDELMK